MQLTTWSTFTITVLADFPLDFAKDLQTRGIEDDMHRPFGQMVAQELSADRPGDGTRANRKHILVSQKTRQHTVIEAFGYGIKAQRENAHLHSLLIFILSDKHDKRPTSFAESIHDGAIPLIFWTVY